MYSIQPLPDLRSFRMMRYYNVRNLKENTYAKRQFFSFWKRKRHVKVVEEYYWAVT